MGTETRQMKVHKASEKEIDALNDILNELASLHDHFNNDYAMKAVKENKEEFPILSRLNLKDPEEFIEGICSAISHSRHASIIFNLRTLMHNCADPNAETLEFNSRIQEAFNAKEKWDDLYGKVEACYFDEEGEEKFEDETDLGTIGEITATAMGFL